MRPCLGVEGWMGGGKEDKGRVLEGKGKTAEEKLRDCAGIPSDFR